jgi:hypothetical protein
VSGKIGAALAAPTNERLRPHLPRIDVLPNEAETVDQFEKAILARSDLPLFGRSGRLVRLQAVDGGSVVSSGVERPVGAVCIKDAEKPWLRDELSRSAEVYRFDKRTGAPVHSLVPTWVPEILMTRGDRFLPLVGVIETPTLRPDGSVLTKPGYDPATRLFFAPSTNYPAVKDRPTIDDARAALSDLLLPLADFPFVAQSHRSTAVAAILSLLGRGAINGPVPMFTIGASTPGTGKSLLARVIATVGAGRAPASFPPAEDNAEWRKRIFSVALRGDPVVLIDNVTGELGSPALDQALTETEISDRELGANRVTSAPLRAVWMSTGNNVQLRGDLPRRVVPIELDAVSEHPEDRADFSIRNLHTWVAERRARLTTAALTVLRAFYVAGRPVPQWTPMGSYGAWEALVRGCVIWLGLADPLDGQKKIRHDATDAQTELRAVLDAWATAHRDEWKTAKAAHAGIGAALPRRKGEAISDRAFSSWLHHHERRIVAGRRLVSEWDAHRNTTIWRVESGLT